MSAIASQITSIAIVYSIVYSGTDQRKHQSCASLAVVRGIHRWPVNSPRKVPVTGKMFPFDDVILYFVIVIKPLSCYGNWFKCNFACYLFKFCCLPVLNYRHTVCWQQVYNALCTKLTYKLIQSNFESVSVHAEHPLCWACFHIDVTSYLCKEFDVDLKIRYCFS